MDITEFNLGDIVALQTHPYFFNATSIIVSGEPQMLSPLMVVSEILKESEKYDEKTGEVLVSAGQGQCKCSWYSPKSHKYEEDWISSKLLKRIKSGNEFSNDFKIGSIVSLRTLKLELGKAKSSVSYEEELGIAKTNITALLPYVSPNLQILQKVELKNSDFKDAIYDSRKGIQKRFFSSTAYKCRWFNQHLDKVSEVTLSSNVLTVIEQFDENFIKSIIEKIKQPAYYVFSKTDAEIAHKLDRSVIKPLKIKFLHGVYYISSYDYILNKVVEFELVKESLIEVKEPYIFKAPIFNHKSGDTAPSPESILIEILDAIKTAHSENYFIAIKYFDYNEKITTRTLKDYEIISLFDEGDEVLYLTGFCFLRNDKRTFRLDRIQSVNAIDLKYK